MAYFNQEMKQNKSALIKDICKKFGMKVSLSVSNHSTFVINLPAGKLDLISNYKEVYGSIPMEDWKKEHLAETTNLRVNEFWYHEHFSGECLAFLGELIAAANDGNWDKSDPQTDYFNVGWYLSINVGKWNKPYELI